MLLHLVRHPQPLVASGLCYGSSDVAVEQEVCQQVCDTITTQMSARSSTSLLYSSPLQRCAVLAEALAVQWSNPVRYDPRLKEMHFGDWEMRSWNDIDRTLIDAWTADLIGYHPGNGESVLQVAQRLQNFLRDLRQRMESEKYQEAVVVCHAGSIRILMALLNKAGTVTLEQAALQAAARPHAIAYGQMITVTI